MNSYEEKQERRRERLENAADRAKRESEAGFRQSQAATAGIPFGQPVLVGHHSEKHHRRALEKSDAGMRKSIDNAKLAQDLARRAEAVGTGGISSDDPEAVVKLKEKLAMLEAERDQMKQVNAVFRKAKGGTDGVKAVIAAGLMSEKDAISTMSLNLRCGHDKLYPAYAITNIGGRIRDIKGRIEHLQRRDEAPAREPYVRETDMGEVRIAEDRELNRVQVYFPGKPSEEIREKLKSFGFRWAPSENAWQRQLSNGAWYWAMQIVDGMPALSDLARDVNKSKA